MILKNLNYFYSKKDNNFNPYIDNYRAFGLDYKILEDNLIKINFSKFGLLTINNSALNSRLRLSEEELTMLVLKNQLFYKEEKKF